MSVHKLVVGVILAGGVAGVFGAGVAHADDGTDVINGWTVTPTGDSGSDLVTTSATLSDPSDSLGLGTEPIDGDWVSGPATPLSTIGSDEQFTTALLQLSSPGALNPSDNLMIQDNWFSGFEIAAVQAGQNEADESFLVPDASGKEVVDLLNFGTPDTPLFNPDATGAIDIGGVQLADPQDGALFNDLFDAVFQGNATDWSHAMTLFGDLFGSSADATAGAAAAAADAVDPSGWLDLFNLF